MYNFPRIDHRRIKLSSGEIPPDSIMLWMVSVLCMLLYPEKAHATHEFVTDGMKWWLCMCTALGIATVVRQAGRLTKIQVLKNLTLDI